MVWMNYKLESLGNLYSSWPEISYSWWNWILNLFFPNFDKILNTNIFIIDFKSILRGFISINGILLILLTLLFRFFWWVNCIGIKRITNSYNLSAFKPTLIAITANDAYFYYSDKPIRSLIFTTSVYNNHSHWF